jgi:uncharacterized protein (UPF0332 family)
MPSKIDHVIKAESNATFAKSLSLAQQAEIDWALTALFYAALHYVEAYLATQNTHLRSHENRNKMVGTESNLRKTFKEYSHLKYFGYNARYEICAFTAKEVTNEAIPDFEAVKNNLVRFL